MLKGITDYAAITLQSQNPGLSLILRFFLQSHREGDIGKLLTTT